LARHEWWGVYRVEFRSVDRRRARSTPDPLRLRSGQALAALERTRDLRDDALNFW
jgi:hypothetical protein